MPLTFIGHTQTAPHADLDVLWTHAVNGESNAALALINAAAALALATTAEADAQTGITNAATAQATANAALAALAASVTGLSIFNVKASPYNAVGNGIADDTTNIQAACDACDAAGGGIVYFPVGTFLITADLSCTRKVRLMGANQLMSTITAASFKKFKVVGGDVGNVWGGHKTSTLGFERVGLRWGELVGDHAAESVAEDCLFNICTVGLYQGFNCFRTHVTRCKFIDCTTGNYVDFTAAGSTSGASMRFTECAYHDSGGGLAHVGLALAGPPTGGAGIFDIDGHYERLTVAGIQITGGNNREMVSVTNAYFELMGAAAFFVDNGGANLHLAVSWAWSVTEAGWIKSSGGRVFLANCMGNWAAGKFALLTGGIITVDQSLSDVFSRCWGANGALMLVAGSTAGSAAKIVAPSVATITKSAISSDAMTDGSPAATPILMAVPGDGNEKYYEFDCLSTTVTTDNNLRVQFADGATSMNLDFVFPLFTGIARVRVSYIPGGTARATAVFSGGAPGATTTKGISVSAADTLLISNIRFLNFFTLQSGGTCASMQVVNLVEETVGPYVATS